MDGSEAMSINIDIELPPMAKSDMEQFRSSLTAFTKHLAATGGIQVAGAGQHSHRLYRLDTKTDEEYLSELLTVFDEEEADEILRLCRACSRHSFGVRSMDDYVKAVITDMNLDFPKDHVRYELYQTCMANPRDELKTDTPEEQFFK